MNLRWICNFHQLFLNNHHSVTRSSNCYCKIQIVPVKSFKMLSLQETKKFIDVTLRTEDGADISAHRLVMASLSPDFFEMMKKKHEKIQFIPFSAETVNSLIHMAYTGSVVIDGSILEKQFELAAMYHIDNLTKLCSDFVISSLRTGNCVLHYRHSKMYCCVHVVDVIEKFICLNFTKVNNLITELTMDQLGDLLKREDLNCQMDSLLLFTVTWCDHHSATEEQKLELLQLVASVTRKPANVVVSIGGWDSRPSNKPSNKLEIFNNLSHTWIVSPFRLPFKIAYHGLQPLQDKLYIIGGYSPESDVGYRGEFLAVHPRHLIQII